MTCRSFQIMGSWTRFQRRGVRILPAKFTTKTIFYWISHGVHRIWIIIGNGKNREKVLLYCFSDEEFWYHYLHMRSVFCCKLFCFFLSLHVIDNKSRLDGRAKILNTLRSGWRTLWIRRFPSVPRLVKLRRCVNRKISSVHETDTYTLRSKSTDSIRN